MERKFGHLMLDIETMGNESYSSIISIAAVEFDINTGETGRTFYNKVSLQSCLDLGLKVNGDTILWWMEQSDEARKEIYNESQTVHVVKALSDLREFIVGNNYQIWGNSARFDCGILQNAYEKAGIFLPWDFRNERCVRTLLSFAPEIKKNYQRKGTAHNALDDCFYQVEYCTGIWNKLNHSQ